MKKGWIFGLSSSFVVDPMQDRAKPETFVFYLSCDISSQVGLCKGLLEIEQKMLLKN